MGGDATARWGFLRDDLFSDLNSPVFVTAGGDFDEIAAACKLLGHFHGRVATGRAHIEFRSIFQRRFDQHTQRHALQRIEVCVAEFSFYLGERSATLLLHGLRQLVGQVCRGRAAPGAEWEDVYLREADLTGNLASFLKLRIGLARENRR